MRPHAWLIPTLTLLACTPEPALPDPDGAADAETDGEDTQASETETETTETTTEGEDTTDSTDDAPPDCDQPTEAQCEAAGCYPIYGTPIAPDLSCREQGRFAGCSESDICSSAETNARDPEGGCWWFYAICSFASEGWQLSADECPEYEEFHMLPECE